jgi:predicted metal-dependent hydrolase
VLRASAETWVCEPAAERGALLERLAARAHELFAPQLRELAALMGVSFRQLQIRHQRTRWGSCSARGTISLNCCLLFHRPAVVRYLLVHELAHLTHMNHSARFWQLVERYEPQWREHDRELAAGWSQVPGWVLRTLRA